MPKPVKFQKRNRTPESHFRSACLQWLKLRFGRHFWSLRIAGGPYQAPGSPDDICSIRGCLVAFEWKDPGGNGRVGPRQQEMIEAIRAAGGRAYVVSSVTELEAAVAEFAPVQMGMMR